MKQLVKNAIAGAVLGTALLSSPAMAEQKIAVVDVQGIFQSMPQVAEIQNTIQIEFKDRIEELQQLQRDGQFYAERLQRDAATMSAEEKADIEQKIIEVRTALEQKAAPLQQEIQRREGEERNKLLGLIRMAIDTVAAAQDVDLVLNSGAVAFASQDIDLSEAVLEQVSKTN